jgi:nucleoside-diphosphate-sugar epimerase
MKSRPNAFRNLELRRRQGQRLASSGTASGLRDQRILFLGYGFVAKALWTRLRAAGWRARATFRREEQARDLEADRVDGVRWTGASLARCDIDGADAILVSTPPGAQGCPALAAAGPSLAESAPKWIGYLSTNGVYGDHGGAVVDESSPLLATSPRGLARIAAERAWRDHAQAHGGRLVIFRLPGIYGPGRSAFDQIREGRAQRIVKPGQVFSRMHVDDIAAALEASLAAPDAGALFNLADDEPAPPQDVIEYACRRIGAEPPPLIPFEEAALSEMARSFYADNKRVSNALMKRALGVSLRYPTYREGLSAILSADRTR